MTVVGTAPKLPATPLGLAGFAAIAWGLGAVLAGALVFGGGTLDRLLGRRALSGALDAAGIWLLVVVGHSPAGVGPVLAAILLAVAVALGALLGGLVRPRFPRALAALLFVASAAGLATLLPNGQTFLRLALTIVLVATAGPILRGRAFPPRLALAVFAIAAACVACAGPILAASPTARAALYARSVQARAWAFAVLAPFDRDGDRAVAGWGGRDCNPVDGRVCPGASERPGNHRDDNCEAGDGRRPAIGARSSLAGAARGSDVLLVSIDSWRWDLSAALEATREALGPHVELTRAVSPSPKTVTSLSATLRGRPVRGVRFDEVPCIRGEAPVHDRNETLAAPLARAGYRSFAVPTHPYVDPRSRVAAGFETISARGWPGARPFVPATDALRAVGTAVARSDRPVCVWVHLMESHHPYRYGGRSGPDRISGLRASVAWLDREVSRLVRDVARLRGRTPVVAVFGDHGEELGEHGGRLHASTAYAEQVRVAALFAGPGVPPGRFDAPVSTASIPRTILELVGAPAPSTMTEPSLLAALAGEAPAPVLAVSELRSLRIAVGYTGVRYRLVVDPVHDVSMLFDSVADPLERRDVSAARPRDLAAMRRLARAWDEGH